MMFPVLVCLCRWVPAPQARVRLFHSLLWPWSRSGFPALTNWNWIEVRQEIQARPYWGPWGFPGGTGVKEPTCQCRRLKRYWFDPGLGRSPGGGNGNPLHYFRLENPHGQRMRWATVHGVAKSQTWLKWLSTCIHTHCCKEGSENKQQVRLLTLSIGEVSWFLTGGEGRGVSMSGAVGAA